MAEERQLFSQFLFDSEELHETFYLGRVGILKPTRLWIAVTNYRALALVMTHYFFQDAAEGAKILHSFSFPIHYLNFEEPSVIELIIVLAVCGLLAFFTFGVTLLLFLLWWWRVYRRKGFIIDEQPFLCSGHKVTRWPMRYKHLLQPHSVGVSVLMALLPSGGPALAQKEKSRGLPPVHPQSDPLALPGFERKVIIPRRDRSAFGLLNAGATTDY